MPPKPRRGGYRGQRWQKKSTFDHLGSSKYQPGTDSAAEAVINRVDVQIFSGRDMQSLAFPSLVRRNNASRPSQGAIWKLKSDGKMNDRMVEAENTAFKEVLIHSSETKAVEADINRIGALTISENNQEPGDALMCSQSVLWKPKSDGIMKSPVVQVENAHADAVTENATGAEAAEADIDRTVGAQSSLQCHGSSTIESVADHENRVEVASFEENSPGTSNLLKSSILENSILGNLTFSKAEVKAAYYPKFESEHSEEQNRMKMIRMVSEGQASLEVSLKHSGLLFTYAGRKGGAYVGGSFGNIYTAVGVFVLGRTFCEAWGSEGRKKQAEFNDSLERDHMCVSMELVTAVLGDHGQRPQEDYVVVAAVTELHGGKPKFYTTPDIMAFCQEWRLPMNSVWLFSTRKSVTTFFAAYDALREEGTATSVCKVLDEVADLSLPGSLDAEDY